jgi:hypothetical protein
MTTKKSNKIIHKTVSLVIINMFATTKMNGESIIEAIRIDPKTDLITVRVVTCLSMSLISFL